MSRPSAPNRPPAVGLPGYAELVCRSNFSFLGAASHPEELITRAQALRYAALAVTDECSLAGVVRAHLEATQRGLPLIIGSDFSLQPEGPAAAAKPALSLDVTAVSDTADTAAGAETSDTPEAPPSPGHSGGPRLVMLAMSRRG